MTTIVLLVVFIVVFICFELAMYQRIIHLINRVDTLNNNVEDLFYDDYLVVKRWYNNNTESSTIIKAISKAEALHTACKDGKNHKEYEIIAIY